MKHLVESIKNNHKRLLVIGDLMLDIYLHGTASRISPEAPVPVVLAARRQQLPGGAANVVANLRAMNCHVSVVGFVGQDEAGDYLRSLIYSDMHVSNEYIIRTELDTITKTRILANGQHLVRYDVDADFGELNEERQQLLSAIAYLSKNASFDVVIVSDYCKGTISSDVMSLLKDVFHCPIIGDTKPRHKELFKGVFAIAPNLSEAKQMLSYHGDDNLFVAQTLKKELELESIIVTLADKGMLLVDNNDTPTFFKAYTEFDEHDPKQRFDVTGAGDTVISVFAACISAGIQPVDAVTVANIAAGIVVKKIGTSVCELEELDRELNKISQ